MNKKDAKKAIELLVKIAYRQQQIIHKLADVAPPDEHRDPNIDYITHQLVPIVASNLSLPNATAVVDLQQHAYRAIISGVPIAKQRQFGEALLKQIELQKPELAKIFSYTFG